MEYNMPFGLSNDLAWLLGIVIPSVLTIMGWIFVNYLNIRNMRIEKRTVIKLQAYDCLKDSLNEVICSYSELQAFLFFTGDTLERLGEPDNDPFNIYIDGLIREYNEKKFGSMHDKCQQSFLKFVRNWEQYEIVFLQLFSQRVALQEEFGGIINHVTLLISDYNRYFMFMKSGTSDDNCRINLTNDFENIRDETADFLGCLVDVRNNLQNYVFGELIGNTIGKRKVANEKVLTIDTLVEKHANVIGEITQQRK